MKIIGITGGVGSGKSQVLSYMKEEFDAVICQADHVAWELQNPGHACYNDIVNIYGDRILNEDRTINRKHLGAIVFSDYEKLSQLNRIMHPAVKQAIIKRIENELAHDTSYFVIEAALLLEDHYDKICDEIWYIYTNEDVRRKRLKESRGYDDEKIDAIINSQLSEESFYKQCHVVIDNSGDFQDTCNQIKKAMKQ